MMDLLVIPLAMLVFVIVLAVVVSYAGYLAGIIAGISILGISAWVFFIAIQPPPGS